MPVFDRRIAISDEAGESKRPPAVVSSSTTVQDAESEVTDIGLFVPPEAVGLFVSVGPDGEEPATAPVQGVQSVELRSLEGDERLAPQENIHGRVIFVVETPRAGWWRAIVRHAKGSSFVVRATAISRDAIEVVRRQWPKWRCTGCKEGLSALVEVAAVYIAGLLTGTAIATFPALSVAGLALRFHLPEKVIEYILKRVMDVSLDALIDGACMQMELCPAP
jgi:hypothetical protein